jgi:hypothetical protein
MIDLCDALTCPPLVPHVLTWCVYIYKYVKSLYVYRYNATPPVHTPILTDSQRPTAPLLSKRLSGRLTFDVNNKPVRLYKMNYLILSSMCFGWNLLYIDIFMANKTSPRLFSIQQSLWERGEFTFFLFHRHFPWPRLCV